MDRKKLKLILLFVATNAATATILSYGAQKMLEKQQMLYQQLWKMARLNFMATEKFVEYCDPVISRRVMEELEFDWIVRDVDIASPDGLNHIRRAVSGKPVCETVGEMSLVSPPDFTHRGKMCPDCLRELERVGKEEAT